MQKKNTIRKNSANIPKIILIASKLIGLVSSKLLIIFSAKLFTTPIKHKTPKREIEMVRNSVKEIIKIPTINKRVMTYSLGTTERKILLVHGWSGRGTQLFKIADELLKNEYSVISFDGPAHGKSQGSSTIILEFVETILEIEKRFGPFEAAIGHSLGAMALLKAKTRGLQIESLTIIGSGDSVKDILDDFVFKLQLKPEFSEQLRLYFEKKYQLKMDSFDAHVSAQEIEIPVLVIHDKNDFDVPVSAGINIHKNLKQGSLHLTEGLGHRKTLGNEIVIQ